MMSNKAAVDSDSEWDTQGSDPTSPLAQTKSGSDVQMKLLRPNESPSSAAKDKRHRFKKLDAEKPPAMGSGSSGNLPPHSHPKQAGDMFVTTPAAKSKVNRDDFPPHNHPKQAGDMFVTTPAAKSKVNRDDFPPYNFRPALPPEKSTPDVGRSALSERKGRKYKPDYSQEIETAKQGSAKDYPWNVSSDEKNRDISHKTKSADDGLSHTNRNLSSEHCHETKSSPDMPFAGSTVTVQNKIAKRERDCSGVNLLHKFSSQMDGTNALSAPSSEYVLPPGIIERVPYEMHLATTENCHSVQVAYTLRESNLHYIEISHQPSDATMARIADSVECYAGRVWRELFSTLRIITSVIGLFFIELLLFLSRDIFSAIILRSIHVLSDFTLKPILAITTNSLIVPLAAAIGSVFSAGMSALGPIRAIVAEIFAMVVRLVAAFRIVNVQWGVGGRKLEQRFSERHLQQPL